MATPIRGSIRGEPIISAAENCWRNKVENKAHNDSAFVIIDSPVFTIVESRPKMHCSNWNISVASWKVSHKVILSFSLVNCKLRSSPGAITVPVDVLRVVVKTVSGLMQHQLLGLCCRRILIG